MAGIINITDVDGTILNNVNNILLEEQVASVELFDQRIPISGQVYYISSFLKWSTINSGTANTIFNNIPNLISVSDFNGNIYFPDSSLSSTLNNLTDEAVYKIIRTRGARDNQFRLSSGEKVTHTNSDGSTEAGFDYQFSSTQDNWFPWCIQRGRKIEIVLKNHLNKINSITDSFGNIFVPNQNNTNSLFDFSPGQGYIIDVKTNFQEVFLERDDISGINDSQVPFFVPPPRIALPTKVSNKVLLSITRDNLNTAILQIPKHSLISALEVSMVNDIISDTSTFPGNQEIKTFYGNRGQQQTFDSLMGVESHSGNSAVLFNRLDFQAMFNAKLLALQSREVKYAINATNAANQIISNTITLSALDISRIDSNIFLNIDNPTTQSIIAKNISIVITTDGVGRKYNFINVDKKYNGNITSSVNPANASNPVFPKATKVDSVEWKAGELLEFENLYLGNPT